MDWNHQPSAIRIGAQHVLCSVPLYLLAFRPQLQTAAPMLLQPTWPPSHLLHVAVERRVLYMEGPNGREPVVRHIKQDAEIGPFHSSRLLALNVLIARNRWYDGMHSR